MISRRGFLKTLAGIAPILGGAGLCLASPLWEQLLFGENAGCPLRPRPEQRPGPPRPQGALVDLRPPRRRRLPPVPFPPGRAEGETDPPRGGASSSASSARRGASSRPASAGRCRARMNVGGELRSLVYGRPITVHVDPIEKKPLYHFLPGSAAFSLATSGCPLRCKFCQNWEISQASPEDYRVPRRLPDLVARTARAAGGAGHRLHLQRADGLCGVPDRHRPRGEETGAPLGPDQLRDHERGAARGALRNARRDQDRPQGVRRGVLPRRLRRGAQGGAPEHPADRQEPRPPGDRQPRRPDAQRLRADAPGPDRLGPHGDRPRRPGPLHPLPPRLPAPEPPPHAGRDAGAGAGDGDGPGDALCLCGKRPGPSGEPYLLPFLREDGHQTHRLLHRGDERQQRTLRLLPRAGSPASGAEKLRKGDPP